MDLSDTSHGMGPYPAQTAALIGFRRSFHRCLTRWGDALFELADAVVCSPAPVASVPGLSLEPAFRRGHGSLYKALARGHINEDRLRRLLVAVRPPGWPPVFAVDASTWDRCDAETSPERGFYYSAAKHSNGQPIVAGWSYQWITQLDWAPDSWTAPLDAIRIPPTVDALTATVAQIERLVNLLDNDNDSSAGGGGDVPMFVFDAGYDPIALTAALADTRAQILVRISPKRVFHPDPPPRPDKSMGRPRRHGPRFVLADPDTWPEPEHTFTTRDPRYGNIDVKSWTGLHPKLHGRGRWADTDLPPIIKGTVIRVEVEHLPKPTARTVKTLWLWWTGPGQPDPSTTTVPAETLTVDNSEDLRVLLAEPDECADTIAGFSATYQGQIVDRGTAAEGLRRVRAKLGAPHLEVVRCYPPHNGLLYSLAGQRRRKELTPSDRMKALIRLRQ